MYSRKRYTGAHGAVNERVSDTFFLFFILFVFFPTPTLLCRGYHSTGICAEIISLPKVPGQLAYVLCSLCRSFHAIQCKTFEVANRGCLGLFLGFLLIEQQPREVDTRDSF